MVKEVFLDKALFETLKKEAAKQDYTVDQYVAKICLENLPYVAITVKVPEKIIQFLDEQKYFGYTKPEFLLNAINCLISAHASEIDFDELEKLKQKYGDIANPVIYII